MVKCRLCGDKKVNLEKLKNCDHSLCYECLCKYLDNISCAKVKCPVENCTKVIDDALIRKCLNNDKILLYDRMCMAKNTVKCMVKDCPYLVAYQDGDTEFECDICKQPNCLKCRQLHEANMACPKKTELNNKKYEDNAYKYLQKHRKDSLVDESCTTDLLENSERFDCPICGELILPRCGISLRNCMDAICKSCMSSYVSGTNILKDLCCPYSECCRPLTERECISLIGKDKLKTICLETVKPRMYNCQTPECRGLWDFASYIGQHRCQFCQKLNCAECQDQHDGQSCANFRKTRRFIDADEFRKKLDKRTKIICDNCKVIIIKNKGCNALRCPTCHLQVCAYSGREIGPKGCNCTNKNRCAVGCHPGCIPEGDSPYEKQMAKYFWDN